MSSALLRLSLAAEETCGTALFEMRSVPGRVSQTRLRRFPTVDFARDPTTIFVDLASPLNIKVFVIDNYRLEASIPREQRLAPLSTTS
jgi:hypothetical protein